MIRVFSFLVSYLTCIYHPHGLARSEVVIFVRGRFPSLIQRYAGLLRIRKKEKCLFRVAVA
jgi:hypothetical protein